MATTGEARFGPHTAQVTGLLDWIGKDELLRSGRPLLGPFIAVSDFDQAKSLARRVPGRPDWTELRENAESALYGDRRQPGSPATSRARRPPAAARFRRCRRVLDQRAANEDGMS